MTRLISIALLLVGLAGCSHQPPPPAPAPDCLSACDHVARELVCPDWQRSPQGATCEAWLCSLPLKGSTLSCYRAATSCDDARACR